MLMVWCVLTLPMLLLLTLLTLLSLLTMFCTYIDILTSPYFTYTT